MNRFRQLGLILALLISVLIHFGMLWFGKFEKKPSVPIPEKFEVSLVYFTPQEKIIEEPDIIETVVEQNVIKKQPEKREQEAEVLENITLDAVEEEYEETVEPDDLQSEDLSQVIEDTEEEQDEHELSKEEGNDELGKDPGLEEKLPGNLDAIIEELRSQIIKKQVYPYAARKKGIQGVVFVQLFLDEHGNMMELQVVRSSGHKMLDKAALLLVKKVLPFEHNTGESINIEIPIKYSLAN